MNGTIPTKKDIKAVDIITSLNPTDYLLVIQDGKLVKIKVVDAKKYL